jgi:hypothetical protein
MIPKKSKIEARFLNIKYEASLDASILSRGRFV